VLASHQFSDVPNSNIFHGDVDALVDAGVTAGCGGGKYCPNQAVTRGQMAAFMNRLGALAPGKTPVVNADRVDGYHARTLSGVASTGGSGTIAITGTDLTSNFTELGSVTVTPSVDGAIIYTYSGWIRCTAADEDEFRLYVNGTATNLFNVEECVSSVADRSISGTFVQNVDGGVPYTFQMRGHDWNSLPNMEVNDGRSTVLFTPFGVGTAAPGVTSLGSTTEVDGGNSGE
jgi:S-layer homology domain